MGFIAAAISVLFVRLAPVREKPPATIKIIDSSMVRLVGGVMLIGSVFLWLFLVLRTGGLALFAASYQEYLAATESSGASSLFSYSWLGVGVGLTFLASVDSSRWSRFSVGVFVLLFVPLALPIGLRGEVMFPIAAALAIRAKRYSVPSTFLTIAFIVLGLFLTSGIKELRQVGIAERSEATISLSAFDALAETGSSLRPVAEVVYWSDSGDSFINGSSYWAPIERLAQAILPGASSIPSQNDERLMNVLVMERVGPIGFSPVAEAFRNFGTIGVIVIMGIIGLIVGKLDNTRESPLAMMVCGVILVELLINIRNSFVAVPFHLLFGFAAIGLVLLGSLLTSRDQNKSAVDGRRMTHARP
jgi:oligosaccharide repeat unit polymerase